ncbi:hypothetical protein [Selenomonas artemidis]|uniref:hypothetical protein n=1 Tax=Selenomonas artemidis TaxID=671224 RepID=UPI0003FE9E85|nr:hypothetical protein [Selenomonas artemidis]
MGKVSGAYLEHLADDVCPHCRAEKEDAENSAFEESYGLPALDGSEKQIHWARTIRKSFFEKMEEEKGKIEPELYGQAVQFFGQKTAAKWWIDNRNWLPEGLIDKFYEEIASVRFDTSYDEPAADETEAPSVVYPENEVSKDIAHVYVLDGDVVIRSPKNDTIRNTAKEHGFRWDSEYQAWRLKMNVMNGDKDDRIAEIGNALLNEGIIVKIEDEALRERAVNAVFEQRTARWIVVENDVIRIYWEYNPVLYSYIKDLPGARYEDGGVTVKARYFAEIRDFADLNDFKISPGAEKLLSKAEQADLEKARTTVKKAEKATPKTKDVKEIMSSSRDVLDDLLDE